MQNEANGRARLTGGEMPERRLECELTKKSYCIILLGDFNNVNLQKIPDYINDVTPNNPYGRRLSERLPQRVERKSISLQSLSAVDALYGRASESAVSPHERVSATGRRAIEERKKEALEQWAKATGNRHTDINDFTDSPTLIDDVKMGENQFAKLMRKGRDGKLGMIKPTLEEPHIILEEASDGDTTERASSYIFIRSFSKADGSCYYYFTSVTVSKDGKEVVISNQEKSKKRISNLLQTGVIRWINKNVLSASETQNEESVLLDDSQAATQADNNTASLGINSPELSASKGTENSGTDKGTSEKFNKGERFLLASGAEGNVNADNVVEKEQKNSPYDMETITMWADLSSRGADARSSKRPLHTTSESVISSIDAAKVAKNSERSKRLANLSFNIGKNGRLSAHELLHELNVSLDTTITPQQGSFISTDDTRYYKLGNGVQRIGNLYK